MYIAFFSDETAVRSDSGIVSSPPLAILRFLGCGVVAVDFVFRGLSFAALRFETGLAARLAAANLSDPRALLVADGFFAGLSSSPL